MDEEKIAPELQLQLDDVERNAAAEKRFDPAKGGYMGVLCFGLFFVFGIVAKAGIFNALGFGVIGGVVGFVSGACQRPGKK